MTAAISRRTLFAAATVATAAAAATATALVPASTRAAQPAPMWTANLPDLPLDLVVMEDGGLLAGCDDGALLCLDRASGAVRWQVATGPGPVNRPALGAGLVLASNPAERGYLHAIDPASGAVLWTRDMNCTGLGAPALAAGVGGVVGVSGPVNVLSGIDLATGGDLWIEQLGWSPGAPIAFGDSFIATRLGEGRVPRLARFAAATGAVLDESLDAMFAVAVAGDTVITAPGFGPAISLTGHDPQRLSTRWTFQLETDAAGGWSPGTPAVGPDGIYLATVPGMLQEHGAVKWGDLFAVDPADGSRLWSAGLPGGAEVGPVVDQTYGAVYVASRDGIYAFDGATGTPVWSLREKGVPPSALAAAEGWLFIAGPGPTLTGAVSLG